MKIVISRKGFDSQYGGIPSPIFPDGSMFSLPIPSRSGRPFGDLKHNGIALHELAHQLGSSLNSNSSVHLDPDLCATAIERKPNWRASFGQVAQAQRHLSNQGVGAGDIFLFFGWYRHVEFDQIKKSWRYLRKVPEIHSLFGWLQVQEVLDADAPSLEIDRPWLSDHPHVQHRQNFSGSNIIYLSADRLSFAKDALAGAGIFSRWGGELQLTDTSQRLKSVWQVPSWMAPKEGRTLSYHGSAQRWRVDGDNVQLRTVGKGQEFVIDIGEDPVPLKWLENIIKKHL